MPLSDYERKMLEELEAQLANEYSDYKDMYAGSEDVQDVRTQVSLRHMAIGLLGVVAGIGVLIAGISVNLILVGVLGSLIMFAGGWYITRGLMKVPVAGVRAPRPKEQRPQESFMEKQARKWEERSRGDNL